MYTVKKFSSPLELTKFLRGTLIAEGTITTAFAATDSLVDTEANFTTAGAAVDDDVYVSGEDSGSAVSLETQVKTTSSATALALDDTFTADVGAAYRIYRGKIATTDIISLSFESNSANWVLIYEADPSF
tara:strand:+ start:875 stop:1264 length:390 start_codon:yes stop_codon:yes gene_type:complete